MWNKTKGIRIFVTFRGLIVLWQDIWQQFCGIDLELFERLAPMGSIRRFILEGK